ncbi:pyrimidine dimer DNA glycosylase/endonuclease V [Pseudomonadota bacterium]
MGIVSIISHKKKGYSNHPETVCWVGYGWALKQGHWLLAAEITALYRWFLNPLWGSLICLSAKLNRVVKRK